MSLPPLPSAGPRPSDIDLGRSEGTREPGPRWTLGSWQASQSPTPRRSPWRTYAPNALLFLLTAASVYLTGGPRLAGALLSILLAHEMGHYLACRYYDVDATLPFFIPSPWIPLGSAWAPLSLVGTFGAFIRIRTPIPHRRALFDIGIAGPLAGFALCLPALVLGVREAQVVPTDPNSQGLLLGDPLLLQALVYLMKGDVPAGMTVVIGPFGLAAWFGLFMTALNLIPIGQLDGGHVTYALLRERARVVSRFGWWVCVALIYVAPSWMVWAVLVRILGRRHPPTLDDAAGVGAGRVLVGLLGLLIFVVSFVPDPIVGSWKTLLDSIGLTSR